MDSQTLEQLKNIVARTEAHRDDGAKPVKGTAFLIDTYHALTCAHCIGTRSSKTWAENVTLYFSRWGKDPRPAKVLGEPKWTHDLAILKLAEEAPTHVRPLQLALNGSPDAGWDTFAHPSPSEDAGIRMSGTVDDPRAILPDSKSSPPLIQLRCFEGRQSIRGASGGPVVVNHRIIGMLNNQLCQEQGHDSYDPGSQRTYEPVYSVAYALSVDAMQENLRTVFPHLAIDSAIPAPPEVQPPLSFGPAAYRKNTNRMHYWHEAVEFVGRSQELSELLGFASPKQTRIADFVWWLWTAPGGQGKSRLGLHLCKELQRGGWRCGFLEPTTDFIQWAQWQVYQPTFIVIDHVAHRAKEVREALCSLSRCTENLRAPLRLLLLERPFRSEDGWVQELVRHAFPTETAELFSCAYDPMEKDHAEDLSCYERQLGVLSDDDVWQIIQAILNEHEAIHPDRETTLRALAQIDPLQRPLFAIFAAEALCGAGPDQIRRLDRAALVRFVLRREFGLWNETLGLADLEAGSGGRKGFEEHLNLVVFATIAGRRQTTTACKVLREHSVPLPERIFPDWLRVIVGYSVDDAQDTLPPLVPDILGELFVLERLSGNFGVDSNRRVPREQTRRLLDVALAERRDSTIDFIRRCVGDFPDHPALEQFTEIGIPEGRAASFGLYLDYIVAMSRVGHILEAAARGWELVDRCFSHCIDVSQSFSGDSELLRALFNSQAMFYYNRARARNKLHNRSNAKEDCDRAVALIDAAIERPDGVDLDPYTISETRAHALRLRAILRHQDEDIPGALADLERILTDQNVFKETRGEALLVRAALYHGQGDDPTALRDYEQIIEMNGVNLAELRQIAVDEAMPLLWQEGNRALKAGDDESALQRYDRLLKLSQGHADLQAMTLVNKSVIHLRRMNPQAVIEDCDAVLNVQDSPPDQQVKALLHRSQAYLMLRQFELATNDVDEAFGSVSATARQRCTAQFVRAQIRYAQDDPKNAFEDLLAIAGQGECDADLRHRARQLLDQWRAR